MIETQGPGRTLFGGAFSLFVVGATCYFAYAALQGDRGLVEQVRLTREEAELSRRLDALKAERARMETLTLGLSDRRLDLDLLDERARAVLGFIRDDEVVIR
ncbi:MAG: septum formation initiator family protein [Paracoccaceae bacterium]